MKLEIEIHKMAQDIAMRALDEVAYEGKTLREWINLVKVYAPVKGDLISRSEMMDIAKEQCPAASDGNPCCFVCLKIRNAPAVDVRPVVHGFWKDDCTDIVCSECGAKYSDEIAFMNRNLEDKNPLFCPNCGACMDGDPHDSPGQ